MTTPLLSRLCIRKSDLLKSIVAGVLLMSLTIPIAHADSQYRIQELVERARFTLEMFNADENMQQFRAYVPYAHAILIVPDYIKGAFGLGAAGGRGVLIMRNQVTGQWSSPAFYSLRSASIGLQIGGSNAEMVLIFMTDHGISALNKTAVKLGVDASVAAGIQGYGVEGATPMNFSTDIVAFSRVKGAFMGASVSGTSMVVKSGWNHEYYNQAVSPMDILQGLVRNPKADGLSRVAADFFTSNSGK